MLEADGMSWAVVEGPTKELHHADDLFMAGNDELRRIVVERLYRDVQVGSACQLTSCVWANLVGGTSMGNSGLSKGNIDQA